MIFKPLKNGLFKGSQKYSELRENPKSNCLNILKTRKVRFSGKSSHFSAFSTRFSEVKFSNYEKEEIESSVC